VLTASITNHVGWLCLASLCLVMVGCAQPKVQRYGSVIGVKDEKLAYYKELHADVWPQVGAAIHEANIRNYSIYLRKMPDGKHYLFGYFEYIGDDFDRDMKKMAANEDVKRWWKETDPCQFQLPDTKEGNWWASMEEVFHQD